MQLKIFDILSSVIPGGLVLCCLIFFNVAHLIDPSWIEKKISIYKDVSTILAVIFIVASYLAGYIVHAVGSWIEPLLWKTWGGRPTQLLFSGNSTRLGLGSEKESILNWLKSKSSDSRLSNIEIKMLSPDDFRQIFQIAKNLAFTYAGDNFKVRIEEFNNSYVFSRNILVSFLFALGCSIALAFYKVVSIEWAIMLLFLVIIVWWRARDRAFYYSREILVAGYYTSNTKVNPSNA
jgi:hypothetical protein